MSIPSKMQAITLTGGNNATIATVPVPQPRSTYLLAKVEAIALNPTDWKHASFKLCTDGTTSGCDFAGTVVAVGPDVTKDVKVGDRIAGTTHGGNSPITDTGCFSEYTLAKADLVVKLPDSMSFEAGSTFPLGASTVAQGVFQTSLGLNLPGEGSGNGEPVLIYGGSTATGSLAIQYAKLAGYKVLTTCSPHNNDFVKSIGADAVYNYRDADCGKQINKDTNNSLKFAWDTVGEPSAAQICADALSSDGSGCKYGTIVGNKIPRDDIKAVGTIMYTIFNEDFSKFGKDFPASKVDFEFAKKFFALTEELFKDGKLKTHPEKVGEKGLEGALQGMKDMKDGKVSGVKLVYRVKDTPEGSKASVEL